MPSVFLTEKVFADLVLMSLGGGTKVCQNMSRAVEERFKRKGNKVGDSVDVKKPPRFTVSKQIKYDPQPWVETSVKVKVDQLGQVAFDVDSIDATLRTDIMEGGRIQTITSMYAKPIAMALAAQANLEAAQFIALNTFNAVGTPGTTPTAMLTYLTAGDRLVEQGLPDSELASCACVINRKMSSAFVDASKTQYNDPKIISGQMDQGVVLNQLGYRWLRDQGIYTHTTGAMGGTPLVSGAASVTNTGDGNNGSATMTTTGWTASTKTMVAGDVFTIANVYSVHPQTRQSTRNLQQFVVTADVTSANDTTATLSFYPAVQASGQFQNVDSYPADQAVIKVWGVADTSLASKVSPQGLLFHESAFAFVSVPLDNPKPNGVEIISEATDPETGISISYLRALDPITRTHVNRFDMLYGYAALYKELACRIAA